MSWRRLAPPAALLAAFACSSGGEAPARHREQGAAATGDPHDTVVAPPDTAGWDLAVRRHFVIASDAIADLGPKRFEDIRKAPDRGFVANVVGDDTTNAAIRRWYRYSMMTHLLEPAGHAYVVRTRDRRFASVQVLGYYCTGLRPGCLTLRFSYPLPS